ncbi:DUF6884 domain-containing protein [Streptomyces olivaceus]|uniref:DUF6884 domain-containing protein n=1 Tax=Streptomyces olivaceus TaxID=47716 RepID=UPI0022EE2E03|nr:DUF6884 domain-containing protein [Streptomyces olivaceus]GHI98077.1 hypothetical protein TPA0905_75480 [Streptomyces olivaceus]
MHTPDPAAPAEEPTARCPCCGLRRPTESGALAPHTPTRAATDDCPGSGLRPAAELAKPLALPLPAVVPAADAQLPLFHRTAALPPAPARDPRARRPRRTAAEALSTDAAWAVLHTPRGHFGVIDSVLPRVSAEDVAAAEAEGTIHFDLTRPRPGAEHLPTAPSAVGRPIVVIPCSATKLPLAPGKKVPAEELYQGAYFTKALAAARAIPGGRAFILSGLHGFITPRTPIATYEKRLDPRNINHALHREQVNALGRAVRHAPEVIALAGKDYADAAAAIWPHTVRPLAGAAIGVQLQRLTRIAAAADPRAAALTFAAEAGGPRGRADRSSPRR